MINPQATVQDVIVDQFIVDMISGEELDIYGDGQNSEIE